MSEAVRPLLAGVPDARRSTIPLFDTVFFPYAALMVGAAPAAACAVWNSIGLRRWGAAVAALLLGIASWVLFGGTVDLLWSRGFRNWPLIEIVARLGNLAFGLLVARGQSAYVRGHRFLGGALIPLLPAVLVTFAVVLLVPRRALVLLWGLWQVLLNG